MLEKFMDVKIVSQEISKSVRFLKLELFKGVNTNIFFYTLSSNVKG